MQHFIFTFKSAQLKQKKKRKKEESHLKAHMQVK